MRIPLFATVFLIAQCLVSSSTLAQSVGLPLPRLLTTSPMGGRVGERVEIAITGENIEDADELYFSDPRLTAARKLDEQNKPVPNHYVVSISSDCPTGLYEARVMSRLGISSPRVFSVGNLPESIQKGPNTSLATAMEIQINSVCNAAMTVKAVDHYAFTARKGARYLIDCAARRIDSKLDAVLILADENGQDLVVDRSGGGLDIVAKRDGKHVIKIHELTFKGGPEYFYRLSIQELPLDAPLPIFSSTRSVSSISWPPSDLPAMASVVESEPLVAKSAVQKIVLPCDIAGSFYPAADVDTYEFEAKKGDVWWVEIASERLGLPTDPTAIVQRVEGEGANVKMTDVIEWNDIASPMKPSSNGYAYDGPVFDAGSPDFMGKLEIKEDGNYRLQVTDLFGGTRSDPRNVYRLIVRKASPDFALVGWPLHMELRNGDRAALSKPISLRGGSTMAIEVVAIRRDGFEGEISLSMEGLPEGVSATGVKIAAGKSRGMMLITAQPNAPRGFSSAKFIGSSTIEGKLVQHPCSLAEMKWPIPDSWGEIPDPRLVADVAVSVSGLELAPISIVPMERKMMEVGANEKITIPLQHIKRSEFSADTLILKTAGDGFERNPPFSVSLSKEHSEAVLDLNALKIPPGDYVVAFYGGAVAKYQAGQLAANGPVASNEPSTKDKVPPRDIVDIVVTEPLAIRVKPSESK